MQGLSLPSLCATAVVPLPPSHARPSSPPPPPLQPHIFTEPEDTVGMERVRSVTASATSPYITVDTTTVSTPTSSLAFTTAATASTSTATSMAVDSPPHPSSVVTITSISRTTEWRRRKRIASAEDSGNSSKKPRKSYTCGKCGQAMNKGEREREEERERESSRAS